MTLWHLYHTNSGMVYDAEIYIYIADLYEPCLLYVLYFYM